MNSVHPTTEKNKNKSNVHTASTLCRRNLEMVFCGLHREKQIKCFLSTPRQSNLKRQQSHRPKERRFRNISGPH